MRSDEDIINGSIIGTFKKYLTFCVTLLLLEIN